MDQWKGNILHYFTFIVMRSYHSLLILNKLMNKYRQDIAELFEFVDLDDSKIIEFKEFLVAMTVGKIFIIVIYYLLFI